MIDIRNVIIYYLFEMRHNLLIAAVIIFSAVITADCGNFTTADSVYYWFACRQTTEGPVIPEGMDSFSTEDQALASIVFMLRGHYHRAEKILKYFQKIKDKNKQVFGGFFTNYQLNGEPLSSEISPSAQLWLINAAVRYAQYTGDKSYLKFARELATVVFAMEGPEGGISAGFVGNEPIDFIRASDNILASSVFSGLWEAAQSSEYRFAGYRSNQFLSSFLSDSNTGNYYFSTVRKTIEIANTLDAVLAFEGRKLSAGNITKDIELTLKNREKLAVVYALGGEQDKSEELLNDIASNLTLSKKHLGAAALPAKPGNMDFDIGTSAWYIFASESYNPFFVYPAAWKDTDHYFQTFKKFTGDDFEEGPMKAMLVYSIKHETGFENKPRLDWAKENETDSGVLRVFLPALSGRRPGNAPSKLAVSRTFLEPQDFSSVSSVKFWIKGAPGFAQVNTTQPELIVSFGMIDGDGELWVSKEMSFLTRFKYNHSIQFTAGWEKDKSSAPGNGLFDFDKIKEIMFILSQKSENSWDVSIDNLVIK